MANTSPLGLNWRGKAWADGEPIPRLTLPDGTIAEAIASLGYQWTGSAWARIVGDETNGTKVNLTNASVPVTGTFWQATQPVSGTVTANQGGTWTIQPGNTQNTTAWLQSQIASRLDASNLAVTNTGAAAGAVTLTLPAVASQFHYITEIQVVKFATALLTAAAAPVVVTTTNLPGSLAFSFSAAASAQGTNEVQQFQSTTPLKSSAVNTATTIVCPATTATIWRVNAFYYAAV